MNFACPKNDGNFANTIAGVPAYSNSFSVQSRRIGGMEVENAWWQLDIADSKIYYDFGRQTTLLKSYTRRG